MAVLSGGFMWRSSRSEPVYQATAKVFIGPKSVNQSDIGETLGAITFSRDFVASYAQQIRSRPVAERVVEKLQLAISPAALTSAVRTSIVPETRIIEVTVKDTDPDRAARIADGLIDVFVSSIAAQGSAAGVAASVFESALPPQSPVSPRPLRDGALGWILGGVIGVALAMGLEQLDTSLRTREEVEAAIAPTTVLAAVPSAGKPTDERRLWLDSQPGSSAAEAFRILRTNLQFLAVESSIKSLLVTSASPQEGKSTVSANLAASMAAGGYRTLLVDGDMRHPTVQLYFGSDHLRGLSDVLAGSLGLYEAVRETGFRNLFVMTAGAQPPNPSELFGSQRMAALVEELEREFDIVIFDAPPTLIVADAPVLASNLDGVIFVVRAGKTSRDQAREALGRFSLVNTRILGGVLNGSRKLAADKYYGYAYKNYYQGGVASDLAKSTDEPQAFMMPAQTATPAREDEGSSIEAILADLANLSRRNKMEGRASDPVAVDADKTTNGTLGVLADRETKADRWTTGPFEGAETDEPGITSS